MVLCGTNGLLSDIPAGRRGKGFTIGTQARQLRDLQIAMLEGKIQFCSPCQIILTGCRIANTGNFVPRLAGMTGCSVLASHGGCDGTRAPVFTSAAKSLDELNLAKYRGFSITWPNGNRLLIGDTIKLW